MKPNRYVCTHCGRHFEAEEKEIMECPGCFWSTSVKKEEDVPASGEQSIPEEIKAKSKSKINVDFRPLLKLLTVFLVLGLAGFLFILFIPKIKSFLGRQKESSVHIAPEKSGKENLPSPVRGQAASPGKGGARAAVPAGTSAGVAAVPAALTPEEQNILNRNIQVTADRQPDSEEQEVLSRRVPFQTGLVEKLPSQAWTLENYKQLIAEQERYYKVPLPHSYKKKLEDLFKAKYLPAAEAFKNGDIVQARNLWVESLAFPIYANDIKKHRGVVLTMLRTFISDTLSKVGSINSTLVEKTLREKEEAVSSTYEQLSKAIEGKNWEEASKLVNALLQHLDEFSNPARLTGAPAAYPPGVAQVDDAIRSTLFELLNVPPPAIADLDPMRRDALTKKRVIESFLPKVIEESQTRYNEALDAIARSDWKTAIERLQGISSPAALARDAQEKVKILKKMQDSGLDSAQKPS